MTNINEKLAEVLRKDGFPIYVNAEGVIALEDYPHHAAAFSYKHSAIFAECVKYLKEISRTIVITLDYDGEVIIRDSANAKLLAEPQQDLFKAVAIARIKASGGE